MTEPATAALTSSDPEPPVGTVVRDCYGDLWRREPSDPSIEGRRRDWFVIEADGSFGNADPETWTRVAGNQGPVEVGQAMTDSTPATAAHGPQVAGERAADRLMRSLDYRLAPDAHRLQPQEVAVVLHALADHTALEAAREWRYDPSSPWPRSLSIGRWLHDVADQLERDDDAH